MDPINPSVSVHWPLLAGRQLTALLMLFAVVTFGEAKSLPTSTAAERGAQSANVRAVANYARLPLSFERVPATPGSDVQVVSQAQGYTLLLSARESVVLLRSRTQQQGSSFRQIRIQLVGGNPHAEIVEEDALPGRINYFIGNDPKEWRENIPTYSKVRCRQVYRGIDLVYYGNERQLEHDFVVSPGANPEKIRLKVRGVDRLTFDRGDLVMHTSEGELRLIKPEVYQLLHGKRHTVTASYVVHGDNVGFALGAFDRKLPLVIDPVLSYSTYFGGTGFEYGYGIAVDDAGSAYITGKTVPLPKDNDGTNATRMDSNVFIVKIAADGKSLIYSTYLGGTGDDVASRIARDKFLNIYVTGYTTSSDFPTVNAFQDHKSSGAGQSSAFVTKLSADGSPLYSTYLGGTGADYGQGIAVDDAGHAYITGATASSDFPTEKPLYTYKGTKVGVEYDAFVAKLDVDGKSLVYSTYLGGIGNDYGSSIALDADGNAYVTGATASGDFPTQNAYQDSKKATGTEAQNAFVSALKSDGSALIYSTYLGGSWGDSGQAIAVDSANNAYVAGATASSDFPTRNPLQAAKLSDSTRNTAFVAKLAATGQSLIYSTFLGGSSSDWAHGIALDPHGNAFVVGETNSSDFPVKDAFQKNNPKAAAAAPLHNTAFVSEIASDGKSLVYSTYLGGADAISDDYGYDVAVDLNGDSYIVGYTTSTEFPTHDGVQMKAGGLNDAFVAKLVVPTTPWLWTSPSMLKFTTTIGGHNPPSQPITVADLGTGSLSWTASYGSPWLSLNHSTGAATSDTASTTQVSVDATGMSAGTYHDTITVTASGVSGSPTTVDVTLQVDKVGTTTALQGSVSTVRLREDVTFVATVTSSSGTPTGTVSFSENGVLLGTSEIDTRGIAILKTNTLPLGANSVTASYGGDSNFAASTSTLFKVTVTGNASTTTLQASAPSVLLMNNVTFSAHVSSAGEGTPSGAVNFMDGDKSIGTAVLDMAGKASFTISTLSSGTHHVTAVYTGDSNFAGSTSSSIDQIVQDFEVALSGASSEQTITAGESVTYQIQISPTNGTTFPASISLSLSGLPPGATYKLTPPTISAGSAAQSVSVQVQTSSLSSSAAVRNHGRATVLFALAVLPALGMVWLSSGSWGRFGRGALMLILTVTVICAFGCSGGGGTSRSPVTYTLQFSAMSGPLAHTKTMSLTIH